MNQKHNLWKTFKNENGEPKHIGADCARCGKFFPLEDKIKDDCPGHRPD